MTLIVSITNILHLPSKMECGSYDILLPGVILDQPRLSAGSSSGTLRSPRYHWFHRHSRCWREVVIMLIRMGVSRGCTNRESCPLMKKSAITKQNSTRFSSHKTSTMLVNCCNHSIHIPGSGNRILNSNMSPRCQVRYRVSMLVIK